MYTVSDKSHICMDKLFVQFNSIRLPIHHASMEIITSVCITNNKNYRIVFLNDKDCMVCVCLCVCVFCLFVCVFVLAVFV